MGTLLRMEIRRVTGGGGGGIEMLAGTVGNYNALGIRESQGVALVA